MSAWESSGLPERLLSTADTLAEALASFDALWLRALLAAAGGGAAGGSILSLAACAQLSKLHVIRTAYMSSNATSTEISVTFEKLKSAGKLALPEDRTYVGRLAQAARGAVNYYKTSKSAYKLSSGRKNVTAADHPKLAEVALASAGAPLRFYFMWRRARRELLSERGKKTLVRVDRMVATARKEAILRSGAIVDNKKTQAGGVRADRSPARCCTGDPCCCCSCCCCCCC